MSTEATLCVAFLGPLHRRNNARRKVEMTMSNHQPMALANCTIQTPRRIYCHRLPGLVPLSWCTRDTPRKMSDLLRSIATTARGDVSVASRAAGESTGPFNSSSFSPKSYVRLKVGFHEGGSVLFNYLYSCHCWPSKHELIATRYMCY